MQLPDDIYLGEVGGVATNSQGRHFRLHAHRPSDRHASAPSRPFAHGGSRLFQFDRNGKFVREIGKDTYGFMFAQQVRIDPQDNIWVVDQMTNMVMKFDPQGRVAMLLGRKAEVGQRSGRGVRTAAAGVDGALPGAGTQSDLFNRPTDVAWDAAGNIFVADGMGNARVAKFDKDGKFVKSWGKKGTEPGEFANVRHRGGRAGQRLRGRRRQQAHPGVRQRRQLQDASSPTSATPQALCMTPGPNQVLYVSNSNPPKTSTATVRSTR